MAAPDRINDVVPGLEEDDQPPSLGSKLLRILQAGAEGYAQGAGDSDIPEAAFARGLSGGIKSGQAASAADKERRKASRIRQALKDYEGTTEFEGLSDREKVLFKVAPTEVLGRDPNADTLDEATSALIFDSLGIKPPQGARLKKAAAERLTAIATSRDRKSAAQQAAEERRASAKEKADALASRDQETRVQKFSKSIDDLGIPEAVTQMKTLSSLLPKPGGDIPGVGVVDSLKPDLLAGDKARAIRQAVAGIQNIKIKDRSGAAVTPPEFVRLAQEFGSGRLKTEDQFRQGLQTALNTYRERLRNTFAGFTPEVRGAYFQNQDIDDYLKTLEGYSFGGAAPAAPAGGAYEDAEKEARYQAWKKARAR